MTTKPPPKRPQPCPLPLPPPPPPPPPPLLLASASPVAAIEAVVSARAATAMVRIFLDFADMSFSCLLLGSSDDRAIGDSNMWGGANRRCDRRHRNALCIGAMPGARRRARGDIALSTSGPYTIVPHRTFG